MTDLSPKDEDPGIFSGEMAIQDLMSLTIAGVRVLTVSMDREIWTHPRLYEYVRSSIYPVDSPEARFWLHKAKTPGTEEVTPM